MSATLPALNIELFERVIAAISAEPKRLNMGYWISYRNQIMFAGPQCGTVACIAGWAEILADLSESTPDAIRDQADRVIQRGLSIVRAATLLGLADEDALALFYRRLWPRPLLERSFSMQEGTPEFAALTVEVIRAFIADREKFVRDSQESWQ